MQRLLRMQCGDAAMSELQYWDNVLHSFSTFEHKDSYWSMNFNIQVWMYLCYTNVYLKMNLQNKFKKYEVSYPIS